MATRLRGTLVDGLNKPIINATVALLAKGNSLTVLSGSEAIFKTSATGTYDITVHTGYYKVASLIKLVKLLFTRTVKKVR